MEEKNVLMSCYVPQSWNIERKRRGISWRNLLLRGLEALDEHKVYNALLEEYNAVKEKQRRTAELLQKAYKDNSMEEE